MIIVVILGGMLLLGEKYSRSSFFWKETNMPSGIVGTEKENFLNNSNQSQPSIDGEMKSKSFVIRPGNKLSYSQALELYKKDILQFNENCQISSGYRTFGLNNEIMIDNRSPKATTITVGENIIVLGPYDFGFMILKEEGDDVVVNCGEKKNVVFISVK